MKFGVDVCIFNQGNNIKNRKMKISTIHTSDYLRLYGYDKKKVENLKSSERKIYLFYYTKSYSVSRFEAPNNHYAYLQLQSGIIINALNSVTFFNNIKSEV